MKVSKSKIASKTILITLTVFAECFLYLGHCFINNHLYYLI